MLPLPVHRLLSLASLLFLHLVCISLNLNVQIRAEYGIKCFAQREKGTVLILAGTGYLFYASALVVLTLVGKNHKKTGTKSGSLHYTGPKRKEVHNKDLGKIVRSNTKGSRGEKARSF